MRNERLKELLKGELRWYAYNQMDSELNQQYELVRWYFTIPELLEWYTLDEIIRMEYDILHTEDLQRDIEALWEKEEEP